MERLPRLDHNATYKLVTGLIACGFRNSSQEVVNEHIRDYIAATSGPLPCPPQFSEPRRPVSQEQVKSAIAYLRQVATGNYILCWADINRAIDVIELAVVAPPAKGGCTETYPLDETMILAKGA